MPTSTLIYASRATATSLEMPLHQRVVVASSTFYVTCIAVVVDALITFECALPFRCVFSRPDTPAVLN